MNEPALPASITKLPAGASPLLATVTLWEVTCRTTRSGSFGSALGVMVGEGDALGVGDALGETVALAQSTRPVVVHSSVPTKVKTDPWHAPESIVPSPRISVARQGPPTGSAFVTSKAICMSAGPHRKSPVTVPK